MLRHFFSILNVLVYYSDTHDKLKCERCQIIADDAEAEAKKVLPKKLASCRELLLELMKLEDSGENPKLAFLFALGMKLVLA